MIIDLTNTTHILCNYVGPTLTFTYPVNRKSAAVCCQICIETRNRFEIVSRNYDKFLLEQCQNSVRTTDDATKIVLKALSRSIAEHNFSAQEVQRFLDSAPLYHWSQTIVTFFFVSNQWRRCTCMMSMNRVEDNTMEKHVNRTAAYSERRRCSKWPKITYRNTGNGTKSVHERSVTSFVYFLD